MSPFQWPMPHIIILAFMEPVILRAIGLLNHSVTGSMDNQPHGSTGSNLWTSVVWIRMIYTYAMYEAQLILQESPKSLNESVE